LIFVLANIIIAAIQILREINTDLIKSIPLKDEIDKKFIGRIVITIDKGAIIIKDEVISHQYFFVTTGKISIEIEIRYSFSIYLLKEKISYLIHMNEISLLEV
jgi:hypothetical protein